MKKILVFGDSHSVYFNVTPEIRYNIPILEDFQIKVVVLRGSSILGFGKRKSSLNVHDIFLEHVRAENPDYVVLALGQIDVELGYYYRRVVKSEGVLFNEFSSHLVNTYLDKVNTLIEEKILNNVEIVFKGINSTCLTGNRKKAINYTKRIIAENVNSDEEGKTYLNILKETYPPSLERVNNHLRFNKVLREKIGKRYRYFDINCEITDSDTGFVRNEFLSSKLDHHLLDSIWIRTLCVNKLIKCICSNN